jgi:hypothetical protein
MATTSAQAPARMRNHSGVTAPPVAGTAPARARAMGPATANPISPASSLIALVLPGRAAG